MKFQQKLNNIINKNNSLLCIGLDSDMDNIPPHLLKRDNPILEFNKQIIDATHDLVCAYKPNIAFYASLGLSGLKALIQTIAYININYPTIPVILDAKRGDVSSTSKHYATETFDVYRADAATVNPYLGFDSIKPFLERENKGVIVLCRTSNAGATDIQDLKINNSPIYIEVAKQVNRWNEQYKNCLIVVGATWPQQLNEIRNTVNDMFLLIPGIGAQGGDLKATLNSGLTKNRSGLILSASRSIIFASKGKDFAKAARKESLGLREEINKYR